MLAPPPHPLTPTTLWEREQTQRLPRAVSESSRAKSALASPPNKVLRRGAHDGERVTDGAADRTVQIHAADGEFRPACLAVEVRSAVLRGVWCAAYAPPAKRRRSGALRSRNRIRNA